MLRRNRNPNVDPYGPFADRPLQMGFEDLAPDSDEIDFSSNVPGLLTPTNGESTEWTDVTALNVGEIPDAYLLQAEKELREHAQGLQTTPLVEQPLSPDQESAFLSLFLVSSELNERQLSRRLQAQRQKQKQEATLKAWRETVAAVDPDLLPDRQTERAVREFLSQPDEHEEFVLDTDTGYLERASRAGGISTRVAATVLSLSLLLGGGEARDANPQAELAPQTDLPNTQPAEPHN